MKKVIVTGANGFLGYNLCKELTARGISVIALVAKDFNYKYIQQLHHTICIEFDLDKIFEVEQCHCIKDIDVLFHMAWAGVNSACKNNSETQVSNIMYGLHVMEFAEHMGIKRVVVPGSASEYACGQGVIDGNGMPAPSDMYSAAKVAMRYVCQTFAKQHGIDLIWTAITSIYGPGRKDNNLITYTIRTLLEGEKPCFTGLEQQWDYLYVDDLINALVELGEKGIGGKIYPIGSGKYRYLSDYVRIIRDKINPSLPLGIGEIPYKNAILDNQVLDIKELVIDTGFVPNYDFEKGIELTINSFRR